MCFNTQCEIFNHAHRGTSTLTKISSALTEYCMFDCLLQVCSSVGARSAHQKLTSIVTSNTRTSSWDAHHQRHCILYQESCQSVIPLSIPLSTTPMHLYVCTIWLPLILVCTFQHAKHYNILCMGCSSDLIICQCK